MIPDREIQKILIIRTHRIGDILQVTPMVRGLRQRYPHARITILVEEAFHDVVRSNPDIDEVIPFPRVRLSSLILERERFSWGAYRELRDLVRELKTQSFDLVINRQFTDPEAILTALIEPKEVRGKVLDRDGHFIYADPVTARVVEQTMKGGRNPGLKNLVDLSIDVGGAEPEKREIIFPVSLEVEAACRQRIERHGFSVRDRFFGIQAGASRSFKKLASRSLAAIVDHLIEKKGCRVLFFGSREERPLGEEIVREVRSDRAWILNLMGETTLEELGGFLKQCDFLISGDTGTVHVAAAVGTKTISTSYGMTYPYETAPYGSGHLILFSDLPCAPCDDPTLCELDMSCERVLLPEILIPGIGIAEALSRADADSVRHALEKPSLQGVKLLYTGMVEQKGDMKLYDLRQGVPSLQGTEPLGSEAPDGHEPGSQEKLSRVLNSVDQIGRQVHAGLDEFSRGNKVEGFQAILPVFDLWNNVIRSVAEIGHAMGDQGKERIRRSADLHQGLLPVLGRMGQAMEQGDLSMLQDILSMEMAPLVKAEEKALKEWMAE